MKMKRGPSISTDPKKIESRRKLPVPCTGYNRFFMSEEFTGFIYPHHTVTAGIPSSIALTAGRAAPRLFIPATYFAGDINHGPSGSRRDIDFVKR